MAKSIDLILNFITRGAKKDAQELLSVTEDVEQSLEAISDTTLEVDTTKAERGLKDVEQAAEAVAEVSPQIVVEVDPGKLDDAKRKLKDVGDEAEDAGNRAKLGGEQTVTAFADISGPLGDVSSQFSDFGGAAVGAAELVGSAFGLTEEQLGKLAAYLGPAGLAVGAAVFFWNTFKQGAEDSKAKLEELKGVQEALAAGQFGTAAAKIQQDLAPFSKLLEGLGVSTEDATKFITGQTDALGKLTTESRTAAETTALVLDVQKRLGVSYEEAFNAVAGQEAALRGLRESYLAANGSLEQQQQAQFDVLKGINASTDAYMELAKSSLPAVRDAILKYVAEQNKIPQKRITAILADTDPDNIAQVQKLLDELAAGRETTLTVTTKRDEANGQRSGVQRSQSVDGGGTGQTGATYNTTINVNGATDPKSTAKEVDGQLRFSIGAKARAS